VSHVHFNGRASLTCAEFFYRTHDPTQKDAQGNDHGTRAFTFSLPPCWVLTCLILTEYRSAIFYNTPEQQEIAKRVTAEVQAAHFDKKGKKIVTTIEPASEWYDGEEYHQEYLFKNPSGYQCATHRLHW
jgi:peptide-methionine (S)-S-oxide reductase